MNPPDEAAPAPRTAGRGVRAKVASRVNAARSWYAGSWIEDIVGQLKAVDFFNWTLIFGAELLWSALPFIILLSSLANDRIDDDLSRHIGLDRHGAHVVRTLFRNTPAHALLPTVTGLLFAVAGVIAVVGSMQLLYERLFNLERRGWRGLPRQIAYTAILLGVLVLEGAITGPERRAVGPVVETLVSFVIGAAFFTWTIHFLLAGRAPWRAVVRPALVTSVLWLALGIFSAAYFSTVVVADSRTYGTIGVVFSFLTWFILIGSVVVLGAACGEAWQRRPTGGHRLSNQATALPRDQLGLLTVPGRDLPTSDEPTTSRADPGGRHAGSKLGNGEGGVWVHDICPS